MRDPIDSATRSGMMTFSSSFASEGRQNAAQLLLAQLREEIASILQTLKEEDTNDE